MNASRTGRPQVLLGMLVLYLVWGSTYLGIAVAVETIPPFVMAACRFTIAGSIVLGWAFLRSPGTFAWPTRREWRDASIVGALLIGGGMGFVAWGEQTIPSGVAALLIATMPLWIAVLGGIFLGDRLPRVAVAGIVIGFVGVAILVGPIGSGATGSLDPAGLAAIVCSPIAWAAGSLFASRGAHLPKRPMVSTGAQMLTGGLVLATMAAVTGEWSTFDPSAISDRSFVAFLYLTALGTFAYATYVWLLNEAPLPLISTYAYVNPVVAVILGAIVLQEPIDARTVVAGAVIVVAVILIVTARGRLRPVSPQGPTVTTLPGSSVSPAAPTP